MYNPATRAYLSGGSAYDLRRMNGQAMPSSQFDRDQEWRERQLVQMARQQRMQEHQQKLAGIDQQTQLGVAGIDQQTQLGVAGIDQQTQLGVADRQGEAQMGVAGAEAEASQYGSRMDMLGQMVDSVGGVVGNWLNRGVEKLRQEGQNDRLDKMLTAAGPKDGGIFQDATGRGVPMPQQVQPGAKPIYDTETGDMIGREVTLSDGSTKFERAQSLTGPGEDNPFTPGTPQYEQYKQTNGDGTTETKVLPEEQQKLVDELNQYQADLSEGKDGKGWFDGPNREKKMKQTQDKLLSMGYTFPSRDAVKRGMYYTDAEGNVRIKQ